LTKPFLRFHHVKTRQIPGGRDACGLHYWATDAHLSGGAYLHFSELMVGVAGFAAAALQDTAPSDGAISKKARRLCDARPFVPPPDAAAFSETSGPSGDNLSQRPLSIQNPYTGKAFGYSTPPGGRTKAHWEAHDADNHLQAWK